MTTNKKISRSAIPMALALMAAGALVSGAQEVCAQEGAEDGAMYQSLIDSLSQVEIHGFVSQGFLWSSANDYLFATTSKGDFRFNEIGINFSASLTKKLHVGLQLFSRSLGYVGGNQIQLDWAYADYRYRDWLGLRTGKMKIPLGMYNEIRDVDQLRSCIILPQSVYQESNRGFASGLIGVGVYGEAPTENVGSFSYSLQGGTVTSHPSETALNHLLQAQVSGGSIDVVAQAMTLFGITGYPPADGQPDLQLEDEVESDTGISLVGSLLWNDPFEIDGLRLGGSVQYSPENAFSCQQTSPYPIPIPYVPTPYEMKITDSVLWFASLEYVYDNTTFAFELRQLKATMNTSGRSIPIYQEGFYLLLSYALTDALEVGTYYSMFWPDGYGRKEARFPSQPDHTAWQQDLALSARYDIFDFWCVKIEGHYINGTGDVIGGDNISNNDWSNISSDIEENWFLGAIKTSVMF